MAELGSSGGCVKRRQKTERQKKLEKRKKRSGAGEERVQWSMG
jgi:hypothetical protein